MIVGVDILKELKVSPNSAYQLLKFEFTYHSNRIEGSAFTKEELELLMLEKIISGSHKLDDIYETVNSLKAFDYMIDTLNEPLSKQLILQFHKILKDRTTDFERGWVGCWKKYPNMVMGAKVKFCEPADVEPKIDELLQGWNSSSKTIEDAIDFHVKFETIHPVQDGNGRIGRLILLKQCIENQLDLLMVNGFYSREYRKALCKVQVIKDNSDLLDIFDKSSSEFKNDLFFLKESIDYLMNVK